MADESLRWKLVLEENFGKPAREAIKAIQAYEKALQRAAAADAKRQAGIVRTQASAQRQASQNYQRYIRSLASQNAAAWRRDERLSVQNLARQDRAWRQSFALSARNARLMARFNDRWRDNLLGTVSDGIGTLGRLAFGVAGTLGGIALGFAGITAHILRATLQMVAFREGAVTTMAVALGGERGPDVAAGETMYTRAQAIARRTPLDERSTLQAQQQVLTAGFRGRAADAVMAASTDIGAANASDPTAQGRFVRAVGQIRGKGRLQTEELNQLGELGVGRDAVYAAIGRQRGLRETGTALNQRVQRMIAGGQITGDQGVRAVLEAVRTTTSGGTLGGLSTRLGGTLGGSLSNLAGSWQSFVTSIARIENLPGVRALADAVRQIGDTLGGANENGQRFQGIFANVINSLGLAIGRINFAKVFATVADTIERVQLGVTKAWPTIQAMVTAFGSGFLQAAGPSMESLLNSLRAFTSGASGGNGVDTARNLGLAFGAAAESLALTVRWIDAGTRGLAEIYQTMGTFYSFLYTTLVPGFYNLGPAIGLGLAQGLRDSWGTVTNTLTELASGLPGPVRDALGMHSPSRVFAELGVHTAEGFAVGVESSAPRVESSVREMVTVPSLGGGGGAPRGPLIGQLVVPIHGGVTNEDTAQVVREAVEEVLVNLFGRGALLAGATS